MVCGLAARRGALPTGADVSPGMLAEARRRHPGLTFVEADAVALPFEDGAFDACVGGFVLNHLPAPEAAVAELARVLAPGGALALSLWEPPARNRWLGIVADALAEVGVRAPADIAAGPDSYRFADRAQMLALLRGAGLGQARVERVSTRVRCAGRRRVLGGHAQRLGADVDDHPAPARGRPAAGARGRGPSPGAATGRPTASSCPRGP